MVGQIPHLQEAEGEHERICGHARLIHPPPTPEQPVQSCDGSYTTHVLKDNI